MTSKIQYLKFLPRILFKRGMPLQLIFFVTSRCNLRCSHCFYWRELNHPQKELSLEEIKKIAKNSRLNLLWLSLTGGEPFLRPDLAEIASSFCHYGKVANISIPTNAQLKDITFKTTKKILTRCPNTYISINISLDGLEKTHDKIRGVKGSFSKAIATYLKLKELKKEFTNFGLSIQTTMIKENQGELKELYLFVRDKLKPDYLNLNLVRGNPRDSDIKKVEIRYYEELLALMEEDAKKGCWGYFKFPFNRIALARNFLVYRQIAQTFKNNQYLSPCYSSNLSGVIDENGNVFPCEILEKAKIGNLRDTNYSLSRLWFSKKNDEIRKRIAKNCFCTYECAVSINVLFNPRLYQLMLLKALKF